jgi:hypothetical protein
MSTLALAFLLPVAFVWLSGELFRAKQSHITRSGAYPNRVHQPSSTHFIEILTQERLVSLLIKIPSGLTVERIQVTDEQLKTVLCLADITESRLVIDLDSYIQPSATFTVSMQGVSSLSRSERVWSYEVYAKYLNGCAFEQIGVANILTYSDIRPHEKIFN